MNERAYIFSYMIISTGKYLKQKRKLHALVAFSFTVFCLFILNKRNVM